MAVSVHRRTNEDPVKRAAAAARYARRRAAWLAEHRPEAALRPPKPEGVSPCCGKRWVLSGPIRGGLADAWRCFHCNTPAP